MFADFANLGAFATIFLALFDVVMKIFNRNTKFANVFSRMLQQSTCRESFLSRTIPNIRYVHIVKHAAIFVMQAVSMLSCYILSQMMWVMFEMYVNAAITRQDTTLAGLHKKVSGLKCIRNATLYLHTFEHGQKGFA